MFGSTGEMEPEMSEDPRGIAVTAPWNTEKLSASQAFVTRFTMSFDDTETIEGFSGEERKVKLRELTVVSLSPHV
jgi:hypothetical protein